MQEQSKTPEPGGAAGHTRGSDRQGLGRQSRTASVASSVGGSQRVETTRPHLHKQHLGLISRFLLLIAQKRETPTGPSLRSLLLSTCPLPCSAPKEVVPICPVWKPRWWRHQAEKSLNRGLRPRPRKGWLARLALVVSGSAPGGLLPPSLTGGLPGPKRCVQTRGSH